MEDVGMYLFAGLVITAVVVAVVWFFSEPHYDDWFDDDFGEAA